MQKYFHLALRDMDFFCRAHINNRIIFLKSISNPYAVHWHIATDTGEMRVANTEKRYCYLQRMIRQKREDFVAQSSWLGLLSEVEA